jgi:hypothetical protein
MLLRTAKSCGPDAPTLASSSRDGVSAQPGADRPQIPQATVAKEPGHRGEREISRKTIACGNAGRSGVLVVARVRSTNTKCTRGCGCSGHPAFPTPSSGRKIKARLGRIASRGANVCLEARVGNTCLELTVMAGPRPGNPIFFPAF